MTETPQSQPTPAPPVAYQPQPMLEADARMWSMLINLATVVGVVLTGGTLSIVAILIIWLMFRERSALVDFHGKQQVNLAITVLLGGIAAVLGIIVTFGIGAILLLPAMIAYGVFVVVISIVAAVAANRGEYYRIPLVVRFIR